MLFRQKELLRWLGVSVFEIWVWLLALTIFSVLLVLKVSKLLILVSLVSSSSQVERQVLPAETSWFVVFSPLFVCDGLNAYFCIIVFIRSFSLVLSVLTASTCRQYLDREFRNALLRALWSLFVIGASHTTLPVTPPP